MQTVALIRDIFIILMAVFDVILLAVLVIILWQILRLMRLIQRELPELVGTAKHTLTTVEGTTAFLGEEVARPAIGALSFVAAVRRFVSVITRGNARRGAGQ